MTVQDLPTLNAVLNSLCAVVLAMGYVSIRRGARAMHRRLMITALILSAAFLSSYLLYHFQVGSVPYRHMDWTRPVYFAILIPHSTLASIMTPFILVSVYQAWRGRFDKHRRIARWTFPVWMFVSVSGVIVYLMLYQR